MIGACQLIHPSRLDHHAQNVAHDDLSIFWLSPGGRTPL